MKMSLPGDKTIEELNNRLHAGLRCRFGAWNRRYAQLVTIGTAIFTIAIGAILNYAVTAEVDWIDIQTVGVILMIVGCLGLILSLLYTFVWSKQNQPPSAGYDDPTRRY